jgi:hypothetical protein
VSLLDLRAVLDELEAAEGSTPPPGTLTVPADESAPER